MLPECNFNVTSFCFCFLFLFFLVSSANSSSQATVFEQVCDAGSFFTDVNKKPFFWELLLLCLWALLLITRDLMSSMEQPFWMTKISSSSSENFRVKEFIRLAKRSIAASLWCIVKSTNLKAWYSLQLWVCWKWWSLCASVVCLEWYLKTLISLVS